MVEPAASPTTMLRAFVDTLRSARWAQNLWSMLLALVVTTVAFLAGRALWIETGRVASIWLPTAVGLAQMRVAPPRQRPWVMAGAVLANLAARLLVGRSVGEALVLTSAN